MFNQEKNISNKKENISKLKKYHGENINFVEISEVTDGVVCAVYTFENNQERERDLGVVRVKAGFKTPLQKVLKGDQTIEIFRNGSGTLTITNQNGEKIVYQYPGGPAEVIVKVGELMQWSAEIDLEFAEICYPPYEDGRFENINK